MLGPVLEHGPASRRCHYLRQYPGDRCPETCTPPVPSSQCACGPLQAHPAQEIKRLTFFPAARSESSFAAALGSRALRFSLGRPLDASPPPPPSSQEDITTQVTWRSLAGR